MEAARSSFMSFVKYIWPEFVEGRHHKIVAEQFDEIIAGDVKRLIINMPPRHTKSRFASFLLPAFFLGHFPSAKIIQASHTADLSKDFGRDVRNLVGSPRYQALFPGTKLVPDAKAAGKWVTSEGGEYFAIGAGGNIAGRGADLLILDDIHSEQDYIRSLGGDTSAFDDAFEWYQTGPRQRLQPGGRIVHLATRWHMRDLTGQLIKRMTSNQSLDQWKLIEFPALLPETDNPLWPEYWSAEELYATREELSVQQWSAQYLQNPISETAAIIKRDWWRIWEDKSPPKCEFIIQGWDTAFEIKETSDYSACVDWGVFYMEGESGYVTANIILLDAYRERLEFPDLKKKAYERYQSRQPDALIIEAKASGLPLIQEMRKTGIPLQSYTPVRGSIANPNNKVARVHSVAALFQSGVVWRPETRWAEEVEEEFAAFPSGDHDDYIDASIPALMRFRQGGFISLESDEDEPQFVPRKAAYY
jgi:predicted phage terminase large subunit-like protein